MTRLAEQGYRTAGFQPTYEELKQHQSAKVSPGRWVFSLPTRN